MPGLCRFKMRTGNVIVSVDSLDGAIPDMTQVVDISNNSFWIDTAMIENYLNDTTTVINMFNESALAFIDEDGTGSTNFIEKVDFC